MKILYEAQGQYRYFGNWLMGFSDIEQDDLPHIALLDNHRPDPIQIRDLMLTKVKERPSLLSRNNVQP